MYLKQTLQLLGLSALLFSMAVMADAGKDFLEKNAKKEGVITTKSGLQYKVIKPGKGASPKSTDIVKVHYHGTLIDGKVFDSSVDRGKPSSFPLNRVIKGWTEGLQTMKEGGKTIFYIPPHIAYGSSGQGPIPANSTLIFEVELLEVSEPEAMPAARQFKPKTLAEIKAFKLKAMSCGKPPVLPKDKAKLASIKAPAEAYSACASSYYVYAMIQMQGLMQQAQGSDETMRDEILDKMRESKGLIAGYLDPAIAFMKSYKEMQAL